jgi:perosamine synthetase
MRNQGRGDEAGWLEHERLGYNYRISDINCVLGMAQLERLEEILEKRRRVAGWYNERLKGIDGLSVPCSAPEVERSWFVYVALLGEQYSREDRDRILQGLNQRGIGCRNYFSPIHLQKFYRDMFGYQEGDFPVTEHVASRTVALPFYSNLKEEEVTEVVNNLKHLLEKGA